ncbi:hypothetical protein [Nonomuraea rhodomycinica]|uniref:Uncharacterized protein n=1 Tax=Nonomuraea rhodomycinica TaxID=1712872 RepID=A0A7Y6IW77_9ACTN|nr:hypothetical protein [Nonomuraea rhodomycinica]NUW45536.1 hypothetical protein [Nonomuraea rhodomycinica]
MIEREIVDAYLWQGDDGTAWWMIHTTNPGGPPYVYALPACTFANLAVEYGLDPDDIDTLLDVAIHQLHIPEPGVRRNAETDPAARKGMLRGGRPVTLGNADSTSHAREAHLERVAWVKETAVRVTAPTPGRRRVASPHALDLAGQAVEVDPGERLAVLKATYRPDPQLMAETRRRLKAALGRDV